MTDAFDARDLARWRWFVQQMATQDTMIRAQALLWNSGGRTGFVQAVDDAMLLEPLGDNPPNISKPGPDKRTVRR